MAERLGMTFGELSERMDGRELVEWIHFDRIFLPPERVDTALLCLTVARLAGSRSAKLDDYLPARLQPDRAEDLDVGAKIKAWALARIAAQGLAAS